MKRALVEDTRVVRATEGIQGPVQIRHPVKVLLHFLVAALEQLGFEQIFSFQHRVILSGYPLIALHLLQEEFMDLDSDKLEEVRIAFGLIHLAEEVSVSLLGFFFPNLLLLCRSKLFLSFRCLTFF